ncbi:MAG TPA: hypothetical protein VF620_10815 [Allosphingosinicella sp.]|jgi:hypothetical protein
MLKKLAALACAVSSVIATPAFAGAVPQTNYYRNPVRAVKINYALPVLCDSNMSAAANTVNAIGSKFQLTGTTQNYTSTYYESSQDPDFLNIQDAYGMSAIMRTATWGYASSGGAPAESLDATISVNADRLYYDSGDTVKSTDLVCGTTITSSNIGQRIDFQSAMLHEFGHVMGMDHRTDGSTGPCVMATYLSAGQIKRAFCSDEKGLMLGFYGYR